MITQTPEFIKYIIKPLWMLYVTETD
jgi:hypothetical protein